MISRVTSGCTSFYTKPDAADAFEKILLIAGRRVEGDPYELVVVRSDDGGEFNERKFRKLCQERSMKQKL